MVFETYDGWKLYKRVITLKEGKQQLVYIFSKRIPEKYTPCDLPEDYTFGVNKRTGFPYLKRK